MPAELSYAAVVAHPDDDAYKMAGTVALHAADPDFRFILIHATDGGCDDIREGFPATRESLGGIRRLEDEDRWRALGRKPDRHEWLDFPDGQLDQVPFDEIVGAVGVILDEEHTTVVATFGPDGTFGHPDHIAIGAATDAVFLRLRSASTTGTGFRRLLHGAIPQSAFQRSHRQRETMGLPVFDPTATFHMRGVPDHKIGLIVHCRAVADRIVAGLQQHRSQHHVMSDQTTPIGGSEWSAASGQPRVGGGCLAHTHTDHAVAHRRLSPEGGTTIIRHVPVRGRALSGVDLTDLADGEPVLVGPDVIGGNLGCVARGFICASSCVLGSSAVDRTDKVWPRPGQIRIPTQTALGVQA